MISMARPLTPECFALWRKHGHRVRRRDYADDDACSAALSRAADAGPALMPAEIVLIVPCRDFALRGLMPRRRSAFARPRLMRTSGRRSPDAEVIARFDRMAGEIARLFGDEFKRRLFCFSGFTPDD